MIRQSGNLNEKWTALYVRLSRDDENEGDSNSIAHQIEILTRYCQDREISSYKVYKDDGWSGTNFKRPGFMEMMADIEAGLVSMVVVKDMSRFGRNYLEVGLYTEIRFPELGVRFIAVNDGVDSEDQLGNDFTPFRNIIKNKRCLGGGTTKGGFMNFQMDKLQVLLHTAFTRPDRQSGKTL